MKIFLSYGHDANAPLIHAIKKYLSCDADGSALHDVWIDASEIRVGDDWRERITEGLLNSDTVIAGLSKYSTRDPGVCRDEILISVGVKGGNIKTILLEPSDVVCPPAMISHIQWLDMSDWREHVAEGFESEYFRNKFKQLRRMLETPENIAFEGEITQLKFYLNPISSISRIKALTSKKMYGREWVYQKIEEWNDNPQSKIFWIMAGPGFGKSMFAANLSQRYNAYIPAIQFVEWGKPDHSDARKILCNIAFQLAVRFPDYRKFLLASEYILKKLDQKNEKELFDFLFCESTWMQIDGERQNVWILIDALDEANTRYGNEIAQTIARHGDRLPKWLRFIITSRNDNNVKGPLEGFKPQVCDLEGITQENNLADMMAYLKGELQGYNLSEDVCSALIQKSNKVFLYLTLLVEDFKKGLIDLTDTEKLPNGLGAYYCDFFNRMFGQDMTFYEDYVAPLLQVYIATKRHLSYDELKYLLQPSSETKFYRALSSLEHLFVTKNDGGTERIAFFHNSIENWLTDYKASGRYFISTEDGKQILNKRFGEWVRSKKSDWDEFWKYYDDSVDLLLEMLEKSEVEELKINRSKIQVIMEERVTNGSLGAKTKDCSKIKEIVEFMEQADEDKIFVLVNCLYETTIDSFVKCDVLDSERISRTTEMRNFDPSAIIQAVNNTAVLGAIGKGVASSKINLPLECIKALHLCLRVVSLYDWRLWEFLPERCSGYFSDLGHITSYELDDVKSLLVDRYSDILGRDWRNFTICEAYKDIRLRLFPDLKNL